MNGVCDRAAMPHPDRAHETGRPAVVVGHASLPTPPTRVVDAHSGDSVIL